MWILSSFAALAGLAFFQAATDAQPGTVKQIAPGVWFREGEIETLGHCNNAIIEMKDYLIVVDANFPSGARLAMEAAKKVSNKPVKYVFDTHHHGDHAYGNPVWTQAGATTLAYKGVAEELKRYEPKRWQAEAKVAQGRRRAEAGRTANRPNKPSTRARLSSKTTRARCDSISSAGRTRAAMVSSICPRKKCCAPAMRP